MFTVCFIFFINYMLYKKKMILLNYFNKIFLQNSSRIAKKKKKTKVFSNYLVGSS